MKHQKIFNICRAEAIFSVEKMEASPLENEINVNIFTGT